MSDFSEFSYGYAVTEAIAEFFRPTLVAAPVLPSLIEEASLGYDLKMTVKGVPFFVQFKTCEERVRGNAKAAREGLLPVPHYVYLLRTSGKSCQHEHLLKLEKEYPGGVVYVAPAFVRADELDRCYLDRQIPDKSYCFAPLSIGPFHDRKPHHIAFRETGKWVKMSRPTPGEESTTFRSFLDRIREQQRTVSLEPLGTHLSHLDAVLREPVTPSRHREDQRRHFEGREVERCDFERRKRERGEFGQREGGPASPFAHLLSTLRIHIGCEMYFVCSPEALQ